MFCLPKTAWPPTYDRPDREGDDLPDGHQAQDHPVPGAPALRSRQGVHQRGISGARGEDGIIRIEGADRAGHRVERNQARPHQARGGLVPAEAVRRRAASAGGDRRRRDHGPRDRHRRDQDGAARPEDPGGTNHS